MSPDIFARAVGDWLVHYRGAPLRSMKFFTQLVTAWVEECRLGADYNAAVRADDADDADNVHFQAARELLAKARDFVGENSVADFERALRAVRTAFGDTLATPEPHLRIVSSGGRRMQRREPPPSLRLIEGARQLRASDKPRIYLAGKITNAANWREEIAPGASYARAQQAIDPNHDVEFPRFVLTGPFCRDDGPCAEFVGDHGGYSFDRPADPDGERRAIYEACLRRIMSSDFVFAHIDEVDAFGTLVEIGYARAIGRPIFIHFGANLLHAQRHEFWFAQQAAIEVTRAPQTSLAQAFAAALAAWRRIDAALAPTTFERTPAAAAAASRRAASRRVGQPRGRPGVTPTAKRKSRAKKTDA